MNKLILAAAVMVLGTGAALADPIIGTWKTIADDNGNSGHIQISKCGSKICGTLVKSVDSSGAAFESESNGRKLIWDMVPEGGGAYGGGKVYSPDRDKTYNGKLELSGNSLKVSGCVLGVCRSGGTWSRLK